MRNKQFVFLVWKKVNFNKENNPQSHWFTQCTQQALDSVALERRAEDKNTFNEFAQAMKNTETDAPGLDPALFKTGPKMFAKHTKDTSKFSQRKRQEHQQTNNCALSKPPNPDHSDVLMTGICTSNLTKLDLIRSQNVGEFTKWNIQ